MFLNVSPQLKCKFYEDKDSILLTNVDHITMTTVQEIFVEGGEGGKQGRKEGWRESFMLLLFTCQTTLDDFFLHLRDALLH
jgi:hypothetical protein